MYYYWGFGLHITSEIIFPEFLCCDFVVADLSIVFGSVPTEVGNPPGFSSSKFSISANEYLLHVNGVASYYAFNGNKIIVQPQIGADESSVRLFLLSNVMAAILHQQNKIPLHASGVLNSKGLILFTGDSGVGKSTTLSGLIKRGWQSFTDDVCVLQVNKGTQQVEALASYPMMKLWDDTVEKMCISNDDCHQLRPHVSKYGIYQHDSFLTSSYPISKIFLIEKTTTPGFFCNPMNKLETFNLLQQNSYRRSYVDLMQLHKTHFQIITRLANQVEMYVLGRTENESDIDSFVGFVEAQIN